MTKSERINHLEQHIELLVTLVHDLENRVNTLEAKLQRQAVRLPTFNPNVTPIGDWPFAPTITC